MRKIKKISAKITPAIFFISILLVWEITSRAAVVPPFILPSPSAIVITLFTTLDQMYYHILITLYEATLGFLIAIILSIVIAIAMDSFSLVRRTLYPLIITSQTIPIITLAPLFVIWFGYGYLPKIIIVVLVCFFPVTLSLLQGLASADKELLDLLRSMGAKKIQIYKIVKFPSAMSGFFSGIKISATYAIMGAIIGEWVGGKNGLGVYMLRARHSFSTDKVFATIIVITLLSIGALKLITIIERKAMPWTVFDKNNYLKE